MEYSESLQANKIYRSEKEDSKISFAIVFQFCILIANHSIKHFFSITDSSTRSFISLIFMLLVGLIFLKNLKLVIKRLGLLFIGTYLFFIGLFLFNMLIFDENIPYLIEASFWFFLISLPTSLFYLAIKNKAIFLNLLIKSAYIQIAFSILYISSSKFNIENYDMMYSYYSMISVIIFFYKLYNKFNILDLILFLFGIFTIILVGSRGPLISIFVFCILYIILDLQKNRSKIKSLFIVFVGFIAGLLSLVYFKDILFKINTILVNLGVNSRTLYLLNAFEEDFSTGRLSIYELTIKMITERPILGYGLAGDRNFLEGSYPHNIFLEVIAQFGIIFGFLILLIFLFYWLMCAVKHKTWAERDLAIMFFSIGVSPLFVSGSYITSNNFWLFMSMCVSFVHFKKYRSRHLCRI